MFKFKVDIDKMIATEIHRTEVELLKSYDELESAELRVDALTKRLQRLKDTAHERSMTEAPYPGEPTTTAPRPEPVGADRPWPRETKMRRTS